MSVKAMNARRVLYKKTARQVSNPGQPSPVNRKARRAFLRRSKATLDATYAPEAL